MRNTRVLIVDDERLTRMSLVDFLQEAGYDAVGVGDGQSAIHLQNEQPFNICVVDIRMPGIDGVETILTIHETIPDVHFIICTGSPQFVLTPALKEIGLTKHHIVHKPVMDMNVFISLIDKITGSRERGAEL